MLSSCHYLLYLSIRLRYMIPIITRCTWVITFHQKISKHFIKDGPMLFSPFYRGVGRLSDFGQGHKASQDLNSALLAPKPMHRDPNTLFLSHFYIKSTLRLWSLPNLPENTLPTPYYTLSAQQGYKAC